MKTKLIKEFKDLISFFLSKSQHIFPIIFSFFDNLFESLLIQLIFITLLPKKEFDNFFFPYLTSIKLGTWPFNNDPEKAEEGGVSKDKCLNWLQGL